MTLFSAPNYCGDYDNAGGMMTVDENLMCSFQVSELHVGQKSSHTHTHMLTTHTHNTHTNT